MKRAHNFLWIPSLAFLLAAGCANNPTSSTSTSGTCTPSSTPEASYVLTGYAVSMYTVNSCTGQFTAATPASVGTGYEYPQNDDSEQLVADPLGRFAYVANLVSNVAGPSSISMYTVSSTTGVLTPTTPATVSTGWFPQGIAIDPQGRFVYTANSDDSSVSMFTINQTTGVLTPTTPASVSTLVANEPYSSPGFLTVDPSGRFLYVTASLSEDAAVFMYNINQTTGALTPTSPATVLTGGIPFQVRVAPNGKWAYVVNNLNFTTSVDGVYQYTVNPTTGVLTSNNPGAAVAGNGPTEIAIDPTSSFAYVVNRQDNTVSMYTIDPVSGNLTLHSTATNPSGTIATGEEPFRIDFDPSGKFVYVTNEGSAASIYTVNGDGTLSDTGATGVGSGSVSTAFTTLSR
jgi:6-phosphogluconolactonase